MNEKKSFLKRDHWNACASCDYSSVARVIAGIYQSSDRLRCVSSLLRHRAMIISHEYKFIFIKTAKTAGTSIEVFLSPQCGPEDIVTPIAPPVEGHEPRNHEELVNPISELFRQPEGLLAALRNVFKRRKKFYNHMPAWLIQQRVPAHIWNGYFKFCVERNPWDKVLSHYHMAASRAGGSLSFEEYLSKGRFPINYFRSEERRVGK